MAALFITWILLLLCTIAIFIYNKRDFAEPAFLFAFVFWASMTIVISNIHNWEIRHYGFEWKTTLCIIASVVAFFGGSLIVARFSDRNNLNVAEVHPQIREKGGKPYPYGLFCVLSVILFVLFLRYKVSHLDFSSLQSFTDALRKTYEEETKYGFFTTQILEILVGLAYISFHRLMADAFYYKNKVRIALFLPIGLFLVGILLYTDRNIFIRFAIFCLLAFVMAFNWKGVTAKNNLKIASIVALAVVGVAVVFWFYGHLKQYTSNFERMIGLYAGSGLYGFNLWLKRFGQQFTHGEFMFSAVLNTLSRFGIGPGSELTQKFAIMSYPAKNGYIFATNIFSALRIYYQDFGLPGVAVVSFLTGMLFEKLYQMALKGKFGFWWLFYCAHAYHFIYFPILEQLFLRFHLGLVYEIFWLWLFYYAVYGKNEWLRTKADQAKACCAKRIVPLLKRRERTP